MSGLKNPKHEIFAVEYAKGKSAEESMLVAGYSPSSARTHSERMSSNVVIRQRIAEIQETILNDSLVDSRKLHARWSEMFNADIGDIIDGALGKFKPIHEWPKIWRQMLQGVDVKELFERSKDGGDASWDKVGEIVKIKFIEQLKLGELIGRHKTVDAFVTQKVEQHEHVHIHVQVQEKLTQARQLLAAKEAGIVEIKRP